MWARRHVGAAALRAARAARAWPAVVRAVELEVAAYSIKLTLMVAAVTAVVTLAMMLVG